MAKTLTVRFDDESYELISKAARAENRSIANLIRMAAVAWVQEESFVDDYEMAEIEADHDLLARLKQGAQDGREGKGRFVG